MTPHKVLWCALIVGAFVAGIAVASILPFKFSAVQKDVRHTAITNAVPQEDPQRAAITNVLGERLKLRAQVTVGEQMYLQPYAAGLRKIDASGCPKDFRMAWIDYVNAWERRIDPRIGEFGKDAAALATGVATKGNFDHTLKRAELRDNAEAWRGVKKAALANGVAITD